MTKEKKLGKSCINTKCENCPLGLENPLCLLAQTFYKTTKFNKLLIYFEECIGNAKEYKQAGRKSK